MRVFVGMEHGGSHLPSSLADCQRMIRELQEIVSQQQATIGTYHAQLERAVEQITLLKKALFSPRRERFAPDANQQSLFTPQPLEGVAGEEKTEDSSDESADDEEPPPARDRSLKRRKNGSCSPSYCRGSGSSIHSRRKNVLRQLQPRAGRHPRARDRTVGDRAAKGVRRPARAMVPGHPVQPAVYRLVVVKLKRLHPDHKQGIQSKKQVLFNQQKAIEARRDQIEEKLLAGVLTDNAFLRLRNRLEEQLTQIQSQLSDPDRQNTSEVEVVPQVLLLSANISDAYQKAPAALKRNTWGCSGIGSSSSTAASWKRSRPT